MSRSWNPDAIFKTTFLLVLSVAVFLVLLGGGVNNIQVKYSRFKENTCLHGLFVKEIKDSQFCCDTHYHDTDLVCRAAFDPVNKALSGFLAWIIPLIPFFCTVAVDAWRGFLTNTTNTSTGNMSSCQSNSNLKAVHGRRLMFYLCLFLFRTVVLYTLGGVLESILQPALGDCWYASLTDDGKCKKVFDYSDHIVLFLAHYLTPATLEFTYVLFVSNLRPFDSYSPSVLSIGLILVVTGRTLLFTGMFFHTIVENMMAIGVFVGLVLLPLLYFTKLRVFYSMFM